MVLMTRFAALAGDTIGDLYRVLFTATSQEFSAAVELALGSVSFLAAVLAARTALRTAARIATPGNVLQTACGVAFRSS